MHRIRVWVRSFFGFSRKETNAFLILLPLMLIILISEPVYHTWKMSGYNEQILDQRYADSVLASLTFLKGDSMISEIPERPAFRFREFDPNSIREKDFIAMGLKPYLASRVMRYREKGGRMKQKTDLLKIYGMDSAWFHEAEHWIRIPESPHHEPVAKPQLHSEKKVQPRERIDINTADSTQLMSIFGIGPALSKRIRTYREKLGGFVSMDQLAEVYGLDSVVRARLQTDFFVAPSFIPRQIDLNTDHIEALLHPYIKRKEAFAIIAYRKQHGRFDSAEKLLEIPLLTTGWLEKVRPYLATH